MSELLAVSLKNLRSLAYTGFIELKPITILVGRNSAGKSTFARILPLLRQTAEARKQSPILWWGRLVDFGSFSDSVTRNSEPREIQFGFRVSIDRGAAAQRTLIDTTPAPTSFQAEATITLRETASGHETILSYIEIITGSDSYRIEFETDNTIKSIKVNEFHWCPTSDHKQEIAFDSILPQIKFLERRTLKSDSGDVTGWYRVEPLRLELYSHFWSNSLVHGNTSPESVLDLCQRLKPRDPVELLAIMKDSGNNLPSWGASVANWTVESAKFKSLRNKLLAHELDTLLRQIDEAIVSTASKCAYIEPLRATAERFYRKQGLAIAEVDSKGSNVPFFIDSLNHTEKERFNAWMIKHFQAGIKTSSDGGHLSIKLKDDAGEETNLADVGFGFSQILPVALQLWAAAQRSGRIPNIRRRAATSTIVIEQPELHLHPEYQAKVADLLNSTIEGGNVSLIVETHSPSIINRLGLLISTGQLSKDKIQVLRFEKAGSTSNTNISKSEFNEKGVLIDWPYGFFDA